MLLSERWALHLHSHQPSDICTCCVSDAQLLVTIVCRAAMQVLEETGVRAKSRAVLAIRQAHTALFGKSDLFAVVALE